MRKLKIVLVMVLLSVSTQLFAAAADHLVTVFKQVNTIQGNFKQVVYSQKGQALATSNGNFIIRRPNQFRWDALTPMQQLTIADGKRVWLYQPDLEQVTVSPMSQKLGQTPLAILSGSVTSLIAAYSITEPSPNAFVLVTKNNDGMFSQIKLQMAGSIILQMQLFDTLGQKTVIDFTQVKINQPINANAFQFRAPKGVDVIQG